MKNLMKIGAVLTVILFISAVSAAALEAEKSKVVCPVSGHEITDVEKAPSTEYKGKTYYFCCEGCKAKFKENPEEYLKKKRPDCPMHEHAEHMKTEEGKEHECCGEHAEEMTCHCVCGMEINPEDAKYKAEYEGKTYSFCSEQCLKKFKENPEEYLKKMCDDMVTCPVSGEKVKKSEAVSMEYKGKTYYFGCEGCKAKFEKDPEKYMKKDCPHTKKAN